MSVHRDMIKRYIKSKMGAQKTGIMKEVGESKNDVKELALRI